MDNFNALKALLPKTEPMTWRLIYLLSACWWLTACNGNTEARMDHTSADGRVHIAITGKRSFSVDPWETTLQVKVDSVNEAKLRFELYTPDIDSSRVHFNWTDEQNCDIVFLQTDHSRRVFHLSVPPDRLQLQEITQ